MSAISDLSLLQLAILGLLVQKSQTGYDLRKVFETTPMGHFSSSPGAIYPALNNLEAVGWIGGKVDAQKSLRPKKTYQITKDGRQTLCAHLQRPVTQDDVIWRMDDLMLRFAFMDESVGRESTIRFLKEFATAIETYTGSLQEILRTNRGVMSLTGELALEIGVESYELKAKWARNAIRRLKK